MARIVKETVTVTFSQIVKEAAAGSAAVVTKEVLEAIELMAEQLCGDAVVVEVTEAPAA